MRSLAERFAEAMADSELNDSELAKLVGVSRSAVSQVRSGATKSLKGDSLVAYCRHLNVLPDWLAKGRGPKRTAKVGELFPKDAGESRAIAQFNVRASMGKGALAPEHVELLREIHVDIPQLRKVASFSSPDNLAFITGIGPSMEPSFSDGDTLLIDRGVTEIKYDAVYVLDRDGELFIKRIQRNPTTGGLRMISDNKLYDPIEIPTNRMETFRIRGRVILAWNARKL